MHCLLDYLPLRKKRRRPRQIRRMFIGIARRWALEEVLPKIGEVKYGGYSSKGESSNDVMILTIILQLSCDRWVLVLGAYLTCVLKGIGSSNSR